MVGQVEFIEKMLGLNCHHPVFKNDFGRELVFIVPSFNDWMPIELKTLFELSKA